MRKNNTFMSCLPIGVLLIVLNLAVQSAAQDPKTDKLPRLPGAMLLLGHPPHELFLTTENSTSTLQDEKPPAGFVAPSISSDGSIIASAHRIPGYPITRGPTKYVVSTYSLTEKKWTDHEGLLVISGTIAISPDGTELACQTGETPTESIHGLRILNIKTGRVTIPNTPKSTKSGFSWSPDSRRIVMDGSWEPSAGERTARPVVPSIYVLDVATADFSKLAKGMAPSWSPSGEWIAFVAEAGEAGNKYLLKLIHPDGTGAQVIMNFQSDVVPILKPVWSPDSKALLFNISRDPDKNTWDIYQLDLETLKHTNKFKNTSAIVFGWVAVD